MQSQNPEDQQKIEGYLLKTIEKQAQLQDESDKNIEKNNQIYAKELIEQVNDKELQSEDRICLGILTNELGTDIKRFKRESIDQQQINIQDKQQSILKSKIIINKQNQFILVRDDNYYLKQIDKILFIQRFIKYKLKKERMEMIEKEQQAIQKMNRYRINVLNELIQTEDKYVTDLNSLNMIKALLVEKFPKKQDDIKIMFNIDDILKFNTEFLGELQKQNNLMDPNAIVMQNIVPLLHGFIFYYEYCKAYDLARKLCCQLETYPGFEQFLQDVKQQNLLKGLSLNDYTIKPVQRLPKYVLLFKDLLKHTMPSHPDYQNVKFCLETIEKINDKNNNEMNAQLKQAKLIELYQQFGNISNLHIFEPNIQFIFEDICSTFTNKIEQRITIYAFNNLLLFAKKNKFNTLKYKQHIPITYQSYIKDIQDLVILKNSFEIITRNETIVIVNGDSNSKKILMTKIQSIINSQIELFQTKNDKKLENNICIKVEVLGVVIDLKLNKKVTFYKTNFAINNINIKSHIRFKQIKSLIQVVNKYDSKLKIPIMPRSLSSRTQKAIDERKLKIEQLLQIVLNSPYIIENSEYQKQVLEILDIDCRFYSFPELKRQNPEQFQSIPIRQSQKQQIISLELLQQCLEQNVSQNINKDEQIVKIGNQASSLPFCIEIILLSEQKLQVGFQKNTLTWFIKKAVANYMKLNYFVDFKIFLEETGGTLRVIEDDEKISTILEKSKSRFFQTLKNMFNYGTKFQFIFRKYIYLPWKQEEIEYLKDDIRQQQLMFEIVFSAKNEEFHLGFKDICLITAYYIIATKQKINQNILKKTMSSSIIQQHSKQLWLEQIQRELSEIEIKLMEVQRQQQQMQQNNNNRDENIKNLLNLFIRNFFQNNFLFGMQQFFVECSKETIQILQSKDFGFQLKAQLFIGLNYNGLHFIDTKSPTLLKKIDYVEITEIKSFPIEFTCKIKDYNLKFKSQAPYEIKHLILEYQQIREILNS
ncbi:unnamed protein product [Paramecium sonneborni]|uniref:DH domain-containing protein n=1 Tax=Paramecium sonneborni TaxID=65129 RepID=A0A8S1LPD4_9CILI|nr:unnamed protein product [Paramecium sonneborni]